MAFLFNPAGLWTGTQKTTQTIEIEENRFTSTASNQMFDTNRNLIATGCATAVATRVEPAGQGEGQTGPLKIQ
ncbi:MAG: hypothetical protein ACR2NN_26985 [Bryobacteraceae bacterium]